MKSNSFLILMSQKLPRSFKERGLGMTIRFIQLYSIDRLFDRKYKVETAIQATLDDLKVDDPNKVNGENYNATHVVPLRKMFRRLNFEPGQVFVDLGCGKGRTLFIASEFGFRESKGIEFSHVLCEIASKNCEAFKKNSGTSTIFSIIESDAAKYKIGDDENVFYMFNPFKESILRQVLQNILISLERKNRKIWIIYCKPLYKEAIIEVMKPDKMTDYDSGNINTHFLVFEIGK